MTSEKKETKKFLVPVTWVVAAEVVIEAESEEEAKIREEETLNFLKEHEANVETNSLSEEKSDDSNNSSNGNHNLLAQGC